MKLITINIERANLVTLVEITLNFISCVADIFFFFLFLDFRYLLNMTGFIVVVCSFRVSHRFVNILEVSIPLIKAVPSGFAGAKELNLQSI